MSSNSAYSPISVAKNTLLYSILIPAHNEENNIAETVTAVAEKLRGEAIPFEVVVVDDHSTDDTLRNLLQMADSVPELRIVHNGFLRGMGRAVRYGLREYRGDVVALVMADLSDDPNDVVAYYRKIEEGYDVVFGTRFHPASRVTDYPPVKLMVNRIVNKMLQVMFRTWHNDLTNAFKAYRRHVIESINPLHAAHFNITIELSLSTLVRDFRIAKMPVNWTGRTWGASNLNLREMGRRYLCTLLKIWFESVLIYDDIIVERKMRSDSEVATIAGMDEAKK